MVRLDIVRWRDGAKIIGAIGQKYIDVHIPPRTAVAQIEPPRGKSMLAKFDFGGDLL